MPAKASSTAGKWRDTSRSASRRPLHGQSSLRQFGTTASRGMSQGTLRPSTKCSSSARITGGMARPSNETSEVSFAREALPPLSPGRVPDGVQSRFGIHHYASLRRSVSTLQSDQEFRALSPLLPRPDADAVALIEHLERQSEDLDETDAIYAVLVQTPASSASAFRRPASHAEPEPRDVPKGQEEPGPEEDGDARSGHRPDPRVLTVTLTTRTGDGSASLASRPGCRRPDGRSCSSWGAALRSAASGPRALAATSRMTRSLPFPAA